jgi:hypothetical protein
VGGAELSPGLIGSFAGVRLNSSKNASRSWPTRLASACANCETDASIGAIRKFAHGSNGAGAIGNAAIGCSNAGAGKVSTSTRLSIRNVEVEPRKSTSLTRLPSSSMRARRALGSGSSSIACSIVRTLPGRGVKRKMWVASWTGTL